MIVVALLPDVISQIEKPAVGAPILLTNESGLVVSASLPALKVGVTRGMRIRQARSLCPDAVVKEWADTPYRELARSLENVLEMVTQRIEPMAPFWHKRMQVHALLPVSALAWYLDIGRHMPRDAEATVHTLGSQIATNLNVRLSFGLAAGRFPAVVAARRAAPDSPVLIRRGEEGVFVATLPVSALPLSRDAVRQLQFLGIQTLKDVAALPVSALTTLDSKMGRIAHRLAQGDDPRPVVARPKERVEQIKRAFDGAIEDSVMVDALLSDMGTEMAGRLRQETVRTLELTCLCERGKPVSARRTLREPLSHPAVIGRALMRLRAQMTFDTGITAIEVTACDIAPIQWAQLDLFGTPTLESHRLSDLIEALADRFGTDSLHEVVVWESEHLVTDRRFHVIEATVA